MQHLSTSYGSILKVALPIIVGGFVQSFVVLIDNIFLSQVSQTAFSAAGNGGLFYITLYMLGIGYASGAQIVIARRNGERKYKEIGEIYCQIVYFLLIFAAALFILLQVFGNVSLDHLIVNDDIRAGTASFLNYRSWGIFFAFMNLSYVALYAGIARTSVLMWATGITAILNVVLDYGLIFGNLGLPEMGLEGGALASVISEGFACGYGIIYTAFILDTEKFGLQKLSKWNGKLMTRIAKLSIPLMIQSFISLAAWAAFFIIVEKLGKQKLAISHAVRNVYTFALIPLMGFNSTTKTYVSSLLAENRADVVMPTIRKILILSVCITFVFIHGNLLYPAAILGIFLDDPALIAQGVPVMQIVTGSILLFSASSILFNVISGSGATKTALLIEFMAILIYLCVAYYITIVLKSELSTVWASEYVYFGLLGLVSIIFIKGGRWKTIQV